MRSSADPGAASRASSWVGATLDLWHLLRFRAATVRRPVRAVLGVLVLLGLTAFFAVAPATIAVGDGEAGQVVGRVTAALRGDLGAVLVALLVLAIGSAVGSGGGRELLSRTEAAIHPVRPRTEHLGALVLAPLNLAWLVQVWGLLALTALLTPAPHLPGALLVVLLWVVLATASAQVVGWLVEGVRRMAYGVVLVRVAVCVAAVAGALLHLAGRLDDVVRALPTTWVAQEAVSGDWAAPSLVLGVLAALSVVAGGVPATWALSLPPREELRVEAGVHEARALPRPWLLDADLALLRRLDRASVWRSVGMRRGLLVLGFAPGVVAVVAALPWTSVVLLPGLAASGAALLFGVNAWCLDGRGLVWRETLPVPAGRVFDARALVVGECLLVASGVPLALALVRAGLPSLHVGVSVLACWVVVVVQVLAISMSWSVRSPYGVDLSSPRATPAPHAVMAGYAGRLSLVTTVTGMLFAGLAAVAVWWPPLVLGVVLLAWSSARLHRARRRWLAPTERAGIVLTAAAV